MPLMANTKSAAKRARSADRRNLMNKQKISQARTLVRRYQSIVASGNKEDAAALLPQVHAITDKAVKTGALHRNVAARIKSRTAKALAK